MREIVAPDVADKTLPITERLLAITFDEAFAVRRWWQRLTLNPEELKAFTKQPPWPRGARAALRRCDSPESAMLTEAFRLLWQQLPQQESSEGQRDVRLQVWSCIALVLAEVREEKSGITLGSQLGKQKKETGKPCMSELRFQQLVSCHSPEELMQRLRRALALIDKQGVSVVHLADNIALWWGEYQGRLAASPSKRLGFQWANDYFGALTAYQRDTD
ncbi:type I-E CRISPR-associated protein Cse2/CasB [Litchfieldella rifensis]|uniref:Type I-E CRISPR-associated protein Cse2/CasB n=1 Tax=Litchfieldella rifensis TaxID=762643 RepID=A0ABV7LNR7_9GAMM